MSNSLGATAGAVATIVSIVVWDMAAGIPIPSLERLLDKLVMTPSLLALAAEGYEVGALEILAPEKGHLDAALLILDDLLLLLDL